MRAGWDIDSKCEDTTTGKHVKELNSLNVNLMIFHTARSERAIVIGSSEFLPSLQMEYEPHEDKRYESLFLFAYLIFIRCQMKVRSITVNGQIIISVIYSTCVLKFLTIAFTIPPTIPLPTASPFLIAF